MKKTVLNILATALMSRSLKLMTVVESTAVVIVKTNWSGMLVCVMSERIRNVKSGGSIIVIILALKI